MFSDGYIDFERQRSSGSLGNRILKEALVHVLPRGMSYKTPGIRVSVVCSQVGVQTMLSGKVQLTVGATEYRKGFWCTCYRCYRTPGNNFSVVCSQVGV